MDFTGFNKFEHITPTHRKKDGFEVVKTIRPFFGDMKTKIYFGVWKCNHKAKV